MHPRTTNVHSVYAKVEEPESSRGDKVERPFGRSPRHRPLANKVWVLCVLRMQVQHLVYGSIIVNYEVLPKRIRAGEAENSLIVRLR